jgi:hypothetical protein
MDSVQPGSQREIEQHSLDMSGERTRHAVDRSISLLLIQKLLPINPAKESAIPHFQSILLPVPGPSDHICLKQLPPDCLISWTPQHWLELTATVPTTLRLMFWTMSFVKASMVQHSNLPTQMSGNETQMPLCKTRFLPQDYW